MRPVLRLVLCGVALLSCAPEVVVAPPEPGTVTVTVAASTILQGSTTQATATATDSRGLVLSSEPRVWTSSAPLVASVSGTGLVTALAPGSAQISASVLGRTSGAAVTVLPRAVRVAVTPDTATRTYADTLRFTGAAFAVGNAAMPGAPMAYAISAGGTFAAVSTTGLVTPVLQLDTVTRTVVVRATSDTASGTATLRLRRVPVDTVILNTPSADMVVGFTVQLTAQPRRLPSSNLTDRVVTWTSSNAAVATVSASGLVTSVSAGTATISATSETRVTTVVVTVTNRPVQTVEIVLPSLTTPLTALNLANGRTQQLNTVLKDAGNNVLTGRTVTWSSSATGVATVSATGVVSAVAASGTSTITATSEGQPASFTLTIGNPVSSMVIATSFSLTTVQSTSSTGTVRDVSSALLPNRAVTITSTNPAVVTVTPVAAQTNASGQFTYTVRGISVGSASIIATSEGRADTAAVTITNPVVTQVTFEGFLSLALAPTIGVGRTFQAVAVARDALNNIIPSQAITWTSSLPSASTVSATGLVTGVGAGTTTLTAAAGAITATRTFATGNPVASIALVSPTVTGIVGVVTSVNVTPRDAASTGLGGRPFTATSGDTTIATVTVTGTNSIQITNRSVGSTGITVASEGITATVNVTVTPPPVASVVVSGGTTLVRGNTLQLTATTRDVSSNVLTGRTVTWSSSTPSAATVNASTGLVTGVGVGSTVITATSEGINGTATLSVTTDVSQVIVTPSAFSLAVGATQTLTATPQNASGTALTGRTVSWTSDNPGVASVNTSTGVVTGLALGTTVIRATVEGRGNFSVATVIAAVNVCDPVAHTPPSTVNGSVTTTDCIVTAGTTFEDIFTLTSGASRVMSWNVTPTGGSLLLARQLQQNTSSGPFISTTFAANGMAYGLYGAGTHRFSVQNVTAAPVNYSFTTNAAATIPNECVVVSTSIGSGVSANLSLGNASCYLNSKRYGRFWMHMVAGQQVTITMTAAYDAFLELYPLNGDGSVGTLAASDDDGAGGTNSRIIFTAAATGFFELRARTFLNDITGAYTLSISSTPSNLMAPEANAPLAIRTPDSRP